MGKKRKPLLVSRAQKIIDDLPSRTLFNKRETVRLSEEIRRSLLRWRIRRNGRRADFPKRKLTATALG